MIIAKKNEVWLRSEGAVEYGSEHYKFIVLLHTMFFISLIAEYNFSGRYSDLNIINYMFLVFFIFLQIIRIWVLKSLGKYWNTKIFRIPGSELVTSGPYKYFKHPNYIVVVCEIFTLPLIFNLYYTAVIFTLLNAIILFIRISTENRILEN
ncbi:MAG TPA: isoprenylcysteine carboxylmethyltransferase family protein [Ignavibacteria bacterium]|nr:isoprenylcysteine carboxylmethyltransferase family protein [Ignavibacteria bacterium]HMR41079.1 isoprenylcysteine carboxylmethyltransferase family protein [Ignavibacteria bacterium]